VSNWVVNMDKNNKVFGKFITAGYLYEYCVLKNGHTERAQFFIS
jgi:hypothetical protein